MTGKAAPIRPRKRTLLPPDPPLRGTDGIWPAHIATVRPLPVGPLDDRQPQVLWIDDTPFAPLSAVAIWFNETARHSGFPLAIVLYRDHFDIAKFERGACDHAERTDRGAIGQFLRVLKRQGGFSKGDSPEAHARGIRRVMRESNAAIIEANERALALAPPQRDLGYIVRRCEALMYYDPAPVFVPKPLDPWPKKVIKRKS
jgi:hypothetical protein